MWPQRWKASASSGLTAAATAAPPVAASTAPPRRPRNERRVIPLASLVARPSAAPSRSFSDRGKPGPPLSGREQPVQLLERVHGPLGRHLSVHDVHREGRPRDTPALERLRSLLLVDDVDRQALARECTNTRRKRPAQAAVRAEEDGELGAKPGQAVERGRVVS